jgi:hypothetical protein
MVMADTRLLEQRNGVSFIDCLQASIQSELVTEWERLTGKKLVAQTPLDRMIDEATGYDQAVMGEFVDFVYEFVFLTMG